MGEDVRDEGVYREGVGDAGGEGWRWLFYEKVAVKIGKKGRAQKNGRE